MSDSPVRVLIVFSAAGIGGAERSLVRMALARPADCGVEYHYATLGGEGALAQWLRESGAQPIVLQPFASRPLRPREVVRLVQRVRACAPHVIYVVGVRAATLLRALKPLLGGARIVHGIRAVLTPGSAEAAKFAWPERLLQHLTDGYIANSRAGAQALGALSHIAPQRLCVIANGVDVPAAARVPLAERAMIAAVVANLHPLKGHLAFLNVVRLAVDACPKLRFSFIGRDDMHGAVARRAAELGLSDHVCFEGFHDDVVPLLHRARVFVLPSRDTEGAPTSILEAQAAGLPAVAFRIGGVPDLIRDGVDGCLVAAGDDAAMAAAIVALASSPERAQAMGEAGRAKVIGEYSLQACADRHRQAWQRLVARAR